MWLSLARTGCRRAALLLMLLAPVQAAVAESEPPSTDSAPATGGNGNGDAAAVPEPPALPPEDHRTGKIRALIAGSLGPDVAPQSLFDVPLDDEPAIQVETARLRSLLQSVDNPAQAKDPEAKRPSPKARTLSDSESPNQKIPDSVDLALWQQRLDLDRERLEFYSLTQEQRLELLRAHDAMVDASRPRETEPERLAREAEGERQRSLEAARVARSEAERQVQEEIARLITFESSIATVRARFQGERAQIALRREAILGWQRRVRDAQSAGPREADVTYDALRRSLRASRDDLSSALDDLGSGRSDVPALWDKRLVDIPTEISIDAARSRWFAVERAVAEARLDELVLREKHAAALLEEIDSGNRQRLSLLSHLSREKREAITGFTSAGWDQARSEARHLLLILRYHQQVARGWFEKLQGKGRAWSVPWKAAASLTPLLIAIVIFLWMKKRSGALLALAERRLLETDRAESRTSPSHAYSFVRFLLKVQTPLERFAFFLVALWLIPDGLSRLLEVQLIVSVLGWSLTGALVVAVIDTVVSARNSRIAAPKDDDSDGLRLRSLKLVGRTIVGFGLVLVLSTRLVGSGTIFAWVLSTCWFAGIATFLLLVSWWRGTMTGPNSKENSLPGVDPIQAFRMEEFFGGHARCCSTLRKRGHQGHPRLDL